MYKTPFAVVFHTAYHRRNDALSGQRRTKELKCGRNYTSPQRIRRPMWGGYGDSRTLQLEL